MPRSTKKRLLPLSGGERLFTHRLWGSAKGVRSNNCYAYALGDFESFRGMKSSPGNRSSNNRLRQGSLKCRDLMKRVLADNPKKVYASAPGRGVAPSTIRRCSSLPLDKISTGTDNTVS